MILVCPRCKREFAQKKHDQIYCTAICQAQVWREKNPEKVKEAEKKYRISHPDRIKLKQRRMQLKRKYGLTLEEYDKMLENQKGVCAICKEKKEYNLCVDHDHNTNEIRGLLCTHCNHVVGFAKDNITILGSVINYLKKEK